MKKLLRELEEMVVDAWPAPETEELDGWLLRSSGGPSRRGNSVATLADGNELALDQRIARSEAWYRERGKPPIFQVGPSASPKELEQTLDAARYVKHGETALATATPDAVLAATRRGAPVRLDAKPSEAWFAIAVGASRFAGTDDVFRGFLQRLGSRARFATAYDGQGAPAAACMSIASEDRLGIYAMMTLPDARGKGLASSLLHALAEGAQREQARELYVLVELQNTIARGLYARRGFQDVYQYHYRVRATDN